MERGIFEVKATGGDTRLGGDDIDEAIAAWLLASAGVAGRGGGAPRRAGAGAARGRRGQVPPLVGRRDRGRRRRFPTARASPQTLTRAELRDADRADRRADARAVPAGARRRRPRVRRTSTRSCSSAAARASRSCAPRCASSSAASRSARSRSRSGGGARRRRAGRHPRRPPQGHAAPRRRAALARHRDHGRRHDAAHRAQHDHPDEPHRDLHDGGRQPDGGRSARAAGRARARQATAGAWRASRFRSSRRRRASRASTWSS